MLLTFLMDIKWTNTYASNGTVYRYNGTSWVVDSPPRQQTLIQDILIQNGDGVISGSVLRPDGDSVVSGSGQLDGYVSSSSSNIIEVMTSIL